MQSFRVMTETVFTAATICRAPNVYSLSSSKNKHETICTYEHLVSSQNTGRKQNYVTNHMIEDDTISVDLRFTIQA